MVAVKKGRCWTSGRVSQEGAPTDIAYEVWRSRFKDSMRSSV